MQSSTSTNKTSTSSSGSSSGGNVPLSSGYAPFVGTGGTSSGTSSGTSRSSETSTTGSGYTPGIEHKIKELGSSAERVVTNASVTEQQARQPVQEFTEYIDKPTIEQPTQYVTQQRVMEREEAPIRLKQQEIQQVQQNTVVQEQPVIVRKQEVQVEKEAPIQVTKHSTQHQTLPAIEKKELYVQPVERTVGQERTLNKSTTEGGTSVDYNVKYEDRDSKVVEQGMSDKRGIVSHIKSAAHNVMDKAHDAFSSSSSTSRSTTTTETRRETPST